MRAQYMCIVNTQNLHYSLTHSLYVILLFFILGNVAVSRTPVKANVTRKRNTKCLRVHNFGYNFALHLNNDDINETRKTQKG